MGLLPGVSAKFWLDDISVFLDYSFANVIRTQATDVELLDPKTFRAFALGSDFSVVNATAKVTDAPNFVHMGSEAPFVSLAPSLLSEVAAVKGGALKVGDEVLVSYDLLTPKVRW